MLMVAARLRESDILYQTGALDLAEQRLAAVAGGSEHHTRHVSALTRLAEIACDRGQLRDAAAYLGRIQSAVDSNCEDATVERAELNYATARYAFSIRDGSTLQRGAVEALSSAERSAQSNRLWSLAARINTYLAVDRYHRRDLAGASKAAEIAGDALRRTPGALPYIATHVLTTRAVIDLHDPQRAHLSVAENTEALELALTSGMVSTARDALFNIANFQLYCDDLASFPYTTGSGKDFCDETLAESSDSDDPVLMALLLSARGRYAHALQLIERSSPREGERSSDWLPIFFEPVTVTKRARILFKAGRYADAARVAVEALGAWERSGLQGEGTALRVRAEALEALGRNREAIAAIDDAIGALQQLQPVHHLVGALKCAYRLTKKATYRDRARYLVDALNEPASRSPIARLTIREREVAQLVAKGHSNRAVAARLGLSVRTVENYLASVFSHLGIRARWQLTDEVVTRL
jgi:DNA-binding CsgD family transcriptional regulator